MQTSELQTLDTVADGIDQAAALAQLLIAATDDGTPHLPVLYCLADVLTRAGTALDTFNPEGAA